MRLSPTLLPLSYASRGRSPCPATQGGIAQRQRVDGVGTDSVQLTATRIVDAVQLDGRLDEPFWDTADSITEFRQRVPRRERRAPSAP